MSKHTKGKWKLHDMEEHTIVGSDHLYIAGSNAGSRPDKENRANARLIAAAPELLEACKKAMSSRIDGSCVYATAWWAEMKQAIAKATNA